MTRTGESGHPQSLGQDWARKESFAKQLDSQLLSFPVWGFFLSNSEYTVMKIIRSFFPF